MKLWVKKFLHNISFALLSLVLISGIFYSGFYIGRDNGKQSVSAVSMNELIGENRKVDFESFWRVWDLIDEKFQPSSSTQIISNEEKVWGAIDGLVGSLNDPYTDFLPPSDHEQFETTIQGEFSGVGMEVGIEDDILTVISPLKNTPAEKSGIKTGDKILEIDDISSVSMTLDEAVDKIRGPIGTPVVLTVSREGETELIKIEIIRDQINIPTLDTEIRDDVFIISLYNFSANSSNDFRGALREFVKSKKSNLILDLRGNPGGFLNSAVDIASWFLPSGKIIVTEDFGNKEDKDFRSKGYNIFNDNLDMIVLVNRGSASASEIVAGALQQHGIATIVGEPTFGKGSVQELIQITDDTSFKVTIAQWLTPNGNSISDGGLQPDIVIDNVPKDIATELFDYQLEKAIEIVNLR
jgi:carboxyl-terminal processing protease